jgi:hypothetical protein
MDSGRQIRPAGTKGADPTSGGFAATLNLQTDPARGQKNHSPATRYADSQRSAYDVLALENQVLLTMAG